MKNGRLGQIMNLGFRRIKGIVFVLVILLVSVQLTAWGDWDHDDDDEERDHHSSQRKLRELASGPASPEYKAECASCHMLYPAALLPQRSWKKIVAGLDNHFGENASLDPQMAAKIESYLANNAADGPLATRRSGRILRSIASNETPMRISETRAFQGWHHEVSDAIWKRKAVGGRFNCIACHGGAEKGDFNEHSVRIPTDSIKVKQ